MLRHKEPYVLYHKLLGFYPTDIHLYEQACLHRSSSICEQGRRINNERLEFLGDAILDAIETGKDEKGDPRPVRMLWIQSSNPIASSKRAKKGFSPTRGQK